MAHLDSSSLIPREAANTIDPTHDIVAQLNKSVRPQDDFFRYVNGTWLESTDIPADQTSAGSFMDLHNQAQERVRTIIEDLGAAAAAGTATDTERKIGNLFNSFMDREHIDSLDVRPLQPDLDLIRASRTKDELASAIGHLARTGVSIPFFVEIDVDRNNPDTYIPWIGQSGLGLPDEAYYHAPEHATVLEQYRAFIPKLYARATGVDNECAQSAADTIVRVETALASHHFTVVEERNTDLTNNVMSWDEFIVAHPGFDWPAAFKEIGLNHSNAPSLLVYTPRALAGFAREWEKISLEDWRTYLQWHTITDRAPYLARDIAQTNFDFYGRVLSGQKEMRVRWKRAVSFVNSMMGEAVGRAYVQRYFPPEYKKQMQQLVDDLLQAYRESITSLTWMGDQTKRQALEKLDQFTAKIGYPDQWRDYSALQVSSDDLLSNVRAGAEFEIARDIAKLGKPVDRSEWFMTPQTVNAYYNPTMNEIVFPAAILQPPFFTAGADNAWNYGSIGAVIGHEIGHGFDDQGSKYDGTGKLENWWSEQDRSEFEARTAALVKQYNSYVPKELHTQESHILGEAASEDNAPGEAASAETTLSEATSSATASGSDPELHQNSAPHVNGELTLGENIGDLGGLTIALKAYDIALRREGFAGGIDDAPVIDGVTGAQRFFISYARSWQEKRRTEYLLQLLAVDPHSPAEFRCNGIVKNVDAFAQAFHVQPGDELYLAPEERVHIW